MTNKEQKKKQRRLNYLCANISILDRSQHGFFNEKKTFSIDKELDTYKDFVQHSYNHNYNKHLAERVELLNLFKELDYSDDEAYQLWVKIFYDRWKLSRQYNAKPIPVRKDNPNIYGAEFHGFGTPRQPRKVRKTAWKRFKKLFPNFIVK